MLHKAGGSCGLASRFASRARGLGFVLVLLKKEDAPSTHALARPFLNLGVVGETAPRSGIKVIKGGVR